MEIKSYAKINLALEVKNKIEGYHLVNNLMVPIDLFDTITLEKNNSIAVVNDMFTDNIMIKAANLFFEESKIVGGVKISIDKKIPHSAGLAGGSSNAAALLVGLNEIYKTNYSKENLKNMASKLGSDVPFFISNKPALCTGFGQIINELDIDSSQIDIILIKPNTGLSTKDVYSIYKTDEIDKSDKINNIINALKVKDVNTLSNNIFNDLTKCALSLNKEMRSIYDDLSQKYKVFVSGSGPTMFIISDDENTYDYIKNRYNDIFVFKTKTK